MMNKTNPKVDWYFTKAKKWQEEMEHLRSIMLDSELVEDLKWGVPCYTLDGKNVALIHAFKEYCGVLFPKGALIKDPKKILIQQTENVQAARQARFTSVADVRKKTPALKACIKEAIELEKSGAKVPLKKVAEFKVPDEFKSKLEKSAALKKAFHALTPGRQRAYLLHFGQAKLAATREARVEKYIPQIMKGKGLDD